MPRKRRFFELPPGFGQRLCELRKRAGMRQSDVAREMLGRPAHSVVSQLESGWLVNPTVGLVADYLRAVGAKWTDIAGLLDSYTAQPRPSEVQAQKEVEQAVAGLPHKVVAAVKRYDRAVAKRREEQHKPLEPVQVRTLRGRKLAAAHERRRKVAVTLERGMCQATLGTEPTLITRHRVVVYGQKLWGILCRTRPRSGRIDPHGSRRPDSGGDLPKRGRGTRQARLDEATEWMRAQKVLPEQALAWTKETVLNLFKEMERTGELDRLPGIAVPHKGPGVREQRRQKLEEHRRQVAHYQQERRVVVERLWSAVRQMIARAGVDQARQMQFRGLVLHICYVVDCFGGDSAAQEREIEKYIGDEQRQRRGLEPGLARRVAKAAAKRYLKLRASLPPNPLASRQT